MRTGDGGVGRCCPENAVAVPGPGGEGGTDLDVARVQCAGSGRWWTGGRLDSG